MAYVATLAVVAGLTTATAPPAFAVDDGVSDLLKVLGADGGDDNLAKWTSGLGSVGKLGEQLPLVMASPGGLLGFEDLFAKGVVDQVKTATTFGDLAVEDKDIAIGDGRTGKLTTTVSDVGDGKRLNVTVRVNRTVTGQDMHLLSGAPKVDLTVSDGIDLKLESRLALSVVWTGPSDDKVYVVRDNSTPRLDVDAYGSIDPTKATAAAGILGVTLTGSTFALRAHFVGVADDPKGDGKLFFDELGTGDGELAQDGSLAGLVKVELDPQGSAPIKPDFPGPNGAVNATFKLGAAQAAEGLSLPSDINATVTVSWPDIGTGSPTVTAPGLAESVGKFGNMSVQDLGDGLAQVVSAITAVQQARFGTPEIGDLELPFLRGRLSDAVRVNEKLRDFLSDNTIPPPDSPKFDPIKHDPAQAGQPMFTSLQDLLKRFTTAGIPVSGLGWAPTASKLTFTLAMKQAAPTEAVDLDVASAAASGIGKTYGDKTLTVDGTPWKEGQWVGRRVKAGTSSGEVASNTTNEITLTADWIGGKPVDKTPFIISGSEAHPGAVTFANKVQSGGAGIINANADQTFAKVKPSYDASVTLVLDLRDPVSGAGCATFEDNTQACPFTKDDNGFKTHVESLPLNTDRMMIRTGSTLFTADFPIATKVDLHANAGFFQVRLQGDLTVCESSLSATCTGTPTGNMLKVGLKQLGDASHDIRVGTLFKQLVDDPSKLLDVDVNVRAFGDVTVSLPDAETFLPGGATAKFTAAWGDLTDPSTVSFDTSKLAAVFQLDFSPGDPKALFTALIKTLQTLSQQLAGASPSTTDSVFTKNIPGLGRSLRDLLLSDESNAGPQVEYGTNTVVDKSRSGANAFTGKLVGRAVVVGTQIGVVKEVPDGQTLTLTKNWDTKPVNGVPYALRPALDDAIDQLLAAPPNNMQDAVAMLNKALGTGDAVKFRYLKTADDTPNIVLDVNWQRGYRVASPINLTVPALSKDFVAAEATATAQARIDAAIKMGLLLPLKKSEGPADGSALKVMEDSSIGLRARAELNGDVIGMLGPLSLALGKPGDDTKNAVAKANVSIDLATSGAEKDKPVSFDTFIGGVATSFNATSGTEDCGDGGNRMVCAKLPLFLNLSGASNGWQPLTDITLNITKSTTPSDLFNLNDPNLKIADKAALEEAIKNVVLDFLNLGDGFESYLAKLEQGMALASFNGKLPLIGDDLQKGADFIGKLRTALRTNVWSKLPDNGRPDDAKVIEDFLNAEIKKALEGAGMTGVTVKATSDCTATLKPAVLQPIAVTKETLDPAPAPVTWQYQVVAYQGSGAGKAGDTVPSNVRSASNNPTLNAKSFNVLKWGSVPHASGYKVLRRQGTTGAFQLLRDVKTLTEYKDEGLHSPSAYGDPVTTEPKLSPCPGEFIDGVVLDFTLKKAEKGNASLDIGIPGLALREGANGTEGVSYELNFDLHLRMGLSRQNGFFINTHDGWQDGKPRPELQVGFSFDLPDAMRAELAFIEIDVKKTAASAGKKLLTGGFAIDLKSTATEAGCFKGDEGAACDAKPTASLSLGQLTSRSIGDLFGVRLDATVDIDWDIAARAVSALPGIAANFQLQWKIDNKSPDQYGAPQKIRFAKVSIRAGDFFQHLLGPVIKLVKKVTGPVQPVLDTLYAEIPLISDLSKMAGGEPVTLVTLAKAFNVLPHDPELKFVETIKAVLDFINRLPDCTGGSDCDIEIGSFDVLGSAALQTSSSPTTAAGLVNSPVAKSGEELKKALNTAGKGQVFTTANPGTGDTEKAGLTFPILEQPTQVFSLLMGGDITLVEFDSGPLTLGFSWKQSFGPVYAPPPVFITLSGSASVSLRMVAGLDTEGIRKAVEALRAKDSDAVVKVIDGLYFKTVDKSGKPIPVVTLKGEIAAGASVSVLIVSVDLDGGIGLTISFLWNDPNNDGKFRVTEFGHAVANNPLCLFVMSGQLTLFLRLSITIGIGFLSKTFRITLLEVTLLDFTVKPDCDPDPPKLGGTTTDGTLVVFAGAFGKEAQRGDKAWDNLAGTEDDYEDVVKVIQLNYAQKDSDKLGTNADFDGFAIEMLGERREYLDASLKRVVVDGSGYDRKMIVTFVADGKKETGDNAGDSPTLFTKDAFVVGGKRGDEITTGSGLSVVDGAGGADVIVTGDIGTKDGLTSEAVVVGGPADDKIAVGNGDDLVAGDSTLGTAKKATVDVTLHKDDGGGAQQLKSVFDWTSYSKPKATDADLSTDGPDTITVGLGKNTAIGNGGDDNISVASDIPGAGGRQSKGNILVGRGGSDLINGGSGKDEIFTAALDKFGVDADGPDDPEATTEEPNWVSTGTGNDDVWGSKGVDLVTSNSAQSQKATIRGGAQNDVLIGGYGTDEIYGGPGHDWVIAEPAKVANQTGDDLVNGKNYGPRKTVTKLPLPAGVSPNKKVLVGGTGNDHIVGGDGGATAFGDGDKRDGDPAKDETCKAGSPVASDPVPESGTTAGGDGNDLILGGAGVDVVSAGGGDDIGYGYGAADLLCGQRDADILYGGDDADHAWGGSGKDLLYGDAGADLLFGNDGDDTEYGGAGDDVVEGNNGSDWATGGAAKDTLYGGTRAVGRTDTDSSGPDGTAKGDDLYGDTGEDTLIGDNGSPTTLYPFDLDGATANAGAGDRVHGGASNDKAYGGLGNDIVNGNDQDDYLEGNNGEDTMHGNAHEDRIIGGSSEEASAGVGRPDIGDILFGDAGPDVITGDNAKLTLAGDVDGITRVIRMREFALFHKVELLDLGLTPAASTSGGDRISGGDDMDVAYGQGGPDRMKGDADDDYGEGGPGIDWIEGNLHDDDLVGGSSTVLTGTGESRSGQPDNADAVFGGPGDDVEIGDNGQVLRPLAGQDPTKATVRLGTEPGFRMAGRVVEMYDRKNGTDYLPAPPANRFGADRMSGGGGVDVAYGQDGGDFLSGGAHDDYLEGNGGVDVLRGDLGLGQASPFTTVDPLADPGWPGAASAADLLEGDTSPDADGQDDMIGGTSTKGYRDGGDTFEGNGADDVELGDNGTLVRTVEGPQGTATEKVYTERYPEGVAVPASATKSRVHDPAAGDVSTRFCAQAGAACEVADAFGNDTMYGNGGDDGMWGQDGNDTMHGNAAHDEMYGELGDDTMFGNDGDDAMLGDRGGVSIQHLDAGDDPAPLTVTMVQPPTETFTSFQPGSVPNTRDSGMHKRADLLHDVDGNVFVGASGDPAMAHAGLTEGGKDQMRGGNGFDDIHAGFGDDLANGDSGGDVVFGDDGADVLWGGRGCDPVLDAATPDCQLNGAFDPHARGANDRFLDHSFGGQGADIMDYNPRGSFDNPGTSCSNTDQPLTTGKGKTAVTVDPCSWFPMTNKDDNVLANNQHHHGTDWMYGGWDRDVMQGNVTENGPNIGDRMIDWTGAYNLYTHCNAAYGGQNDIRLLAPDLVEFLTKLAWGDGAGQTVAEVSTMGQSAYRELAFTYQDDFQEHGIGPAFPGTPGHFDNPNACEA